MKNIDYKDFEANERVLLVGVYETGSHSESRRSNTESEEEFYHSMDELYELARACLMYPAGQVVQRMERIHNALYLGPGKLDEVMERAEELEASLIIFNDTLSPSQLRNLQKTLDMPVMDRTTLILEIFRKRARSSEAKLQVELASLNYLKPRLIGITPAMTRQGGTSGSMSSRGAGEKKLELDRRRIDHRLAELRHELKEIEKERETQRKKRRLSRLPLVSLVGYTNAGKSTIMNRLVDKYTGDEEKTVFEADMLFATLDTTIRRICTGNNRDFLLSDTVGFIHKLPTGLVEAFKSTLEEAKDADLIVQVVDYSDPYHYEHMLVTEKTLAELGAGHIPSIVVYNKADNCIPPIEYPKRIKGIREAGSNKPRECIYMSARDDASVEALKELILEKIYSDQVNVSFLIPYNNGAVLNYFMENAHVTEREYRAEGTFIRVFCHRADAEKYKEFSAADI